VAIEGAGDIAASLRALPAVLEVEADAERPGCFTLLVEQGRNLVPDVSALVHRRGWRLQALQVHSGHLDEVFRELTRAPAEVVH
jgi:ABC-2 type transport system ATP-binding protein